MGEVLASRLQMRMVPRPQTTTMEARPIPMTMARTPPLTVMEVLPLTTLMAHRPLLQQPTAPRPPTMTVQSLPPTAMALLKPPTLMDLLPPRLLRMAAGPTTQMVLLLQPTPIMAQPPLPILTDLQRRRTLQTVRP